MNEARFNLPLSADDPRLSEWLDGRLPEADAAQVARLVAASPELTRLVTELRRQKAALMALPAAPAPASFVQDVLAAVDADLNTADDDAAVEAEWRRIERERLDEEIAEARAGAAEPADEPMRHRWPWMVLVGALAAGLLTAIVINRPGDLGDREVALVEKKREEKPWERQRGVNFEDQDKVDGTLAHDAAEAGSGRARLGLDGAETAEKAKSLRNDDGLDTLAAKSAGPGRAAARERLGGGGEPTIPAGERGEAFRKAEPLARAGRPSSAGAAAGGRDMAAVDGVAGKETRSAVGPGGELAAAAAPPAAEAQFGAPGGFVAGGQLQRPVRTVTYRIRTAADRRRLDELVASSSVGKPRSASDPGRPGNAATVVRVERRALDRNAAPAEPSGGTGSLPTERLVLSGPPEALASLAYALETSEGLAEKSDTHGEARKREAEAAQGDGVTNRGKLGAPETKAAIPPAAPAPVGGSEGGLVASQRNLWKTAAADRPETAALLVIEIVDESGVAVGEGQP